jgi:hypothetical protein
MARFHFEAEPKKTTKAKSAANVVSEDEEPADMPSKAKKPKLSGEQWPHGTWFDW